jgi:nitric oxide reductase subunit B
MEDMMSEDRSSRKMPISPLWFQVSIVTFLFGFTVLGILASKIYHQHPPIPQRVVATNGSLLFTGNEIMAGQHLFQKYGLMQFGTIFGHGAYLGPDFTAQYLHQAALASKNFYKKGGAPEPEAQARVVQEFKRNQYNSKTQTLTYTPGQTESFRQMMSFYRDWFGPAKKQQGLQRPHISDPEELRNLTAYFSWAAWTSSTLRPGANYSYTNNWPPEPLVGNTPTAQAFFWSVFSLIALLGGIGLMFFFFGRYNILGWHRGEEELPERKIRFRPPEDVRLSPAQRATAWYFLVVAGLFLAQGLLGGANAHYHVEPGSFYGINVAQWLPYNLSRMWHLQLALFFVSASFLAIGIFWRR